MYNIDSIIIDGIIYNLVYAGKGEYQVLQGSTPTDIRITANTPAEASSKFQARMNALR